VKKKSQYSNKPQEVRMEDRTLATSDDDLDLRIYLKKIIHHWPFLLFLSLAAAILTVAINFILPPVYEATAVLVIPQYATNDVYSANLLQSDAVYKAVLAQPNIGAEILDRITITADQEDKVTYSITVQASNPSQAVLETNTWAEEGIKWIKQRLINSDRAWVNKTKEGMESADRDLLQFLDANGLNAYSVIDLRFYEGTYSPDEYTPVELQEPLALKASVRIELRNLLRAQSNAAGIYADALDRYNRHQMQLQVNSPVIIRHAQNPDEPVRPQLPSVLKNALLALVLALAAGIVIILAGDWWKNPSNQPAQ
jgi:uncharacterized protein involved in exopolysaccharide biosynthesis